MSLFEQVLIEVNSDSYLKECKGLFDKLICEGEYPQEELTENKVIDLLIQIILRREQDNIRRQTYIQSEYVLSCRDIAFYWKILWVVLEEHLGIYRDVSEVQNQELINKLKETLKSHLNHCA